MKKIVFIINSIPNQRCVKRINEFIENGYEIEAYSFVREGLAYQQPQNFTINIIGTFKNNSRYKNRIKILIKAFITLRRTYQRNDNVVFYYFGLDVALFGCFFIRKRFFYEVSDLSQTYITNLWLRKRLDFLEKIIIKNSVETIFTSEGFLTYHYEECIPGNITIIPNRLNRNILHFKSDKIRDVNISNLKIGFVGLIRYKSIINFAKVFSFNYPNHEFHFFGNPIETSIELDNLKCQSNIFFHGSFQNPDDLTHIYDSIDLVLSTYDTDVLNVKYAEPNKIYEAIFFQTPIIVSRDTFLSDKVEKLGIGYSIDAMNDVNILNFINNLTYLDISIKIRNCEALPISYSINNNADFFQKIQSNV